MVLSISAAVYWPCVGLFLQSREILGHSARKCPPGAYPLLPYDSALAAALPVDTERLDQTQAQLPVRTDPAVGFWAPIQPIYRPAPTLFAEGRSRSGAVA